MSKRSKTFMFFNKIKVLLHIHLEFLLYFVHDIHRRRNCTCRRIALEIMWTWTRNMNKNIGSWKTFTLLKNWFVTKTWTGNGVDSLSFQQIWERKIF